MKYSLMLIIISFSLEFDWKSQASKLEKSSFQRTISSKTYNDIMSHASIINGSPFRHITGLPSLDAHETTHGICGKNRSKNSSTIYAGNGMAIVIPSINFTKQEVIKFIPSSIRKLTSVNNSINSETGETNTHFTTYISKQPNPHPNALHIFEEWSCYVVDSTVTLELLDSGNNVYQSGFEVDGNMTFTYFSIAALFALSKQENLNSKLELKAAFVNLCERSMNNYKKILKHPNLIGYKTSIAVYNNLKHAEDSKHLRNFLKEWMGEEWTKEVLDIN